MNALSLLSGLTDISATTPGLASRVRFHVADALACLSAATVTEEGAALRAFYLQRGNSASDCAPAAAAMIRMTEWDDIHVQSCVTPGAVAIPVALMLAQDDAHLVASILAGYAIGIGIGEAIGGVTALPGTWPGLLAAPAIAAVAAATALGLSKEERAQALVLALAGASGRNGRPSGAPSARWLVIGEAVLKGLRAADAAQAGFKGDLQLLSADWLKAQNPNAPGWGDLRGDAILATGLKPFISARQGINAISAYRQLLAQVADPADIEAVEVALPPEAVAVVSRPLELNDRLSKIAHLGLQLGIHTFNSPLCLDVGRTGSISQECLDLAARVSVHADPALGGLSNEWPARVRLLYRGRWLEHVAISNAADNVGLQAMVLDKIATVRGVDPVLGNQISAFANAQSAMLAQGRNMLEELLGGKAGISINNAESATVYQHGVPDHS